MLYSHDTSKTLNEQLGQFPDAAVTLTKQGGTNVVWNTMSLTAAKVPIMPPTIPRMIMKIDSPFTGSEISLK